MKIFIILQVSINFIFYFSNYSRSYWISRMGGGTGSNGGGVLFYTGEIKNLAFFHTRKVSKKF